MATLGQAVRDWPYVQELAAGGDKTDRDKIIAGHVINAMFKHGRGSASCLLEWGEQAQRQGTV